MLSLSPPFRDPNLPNINLSTYQCHDARTMALILIYPCHDPSMFDDDPNLFDINPNNYTLFVTTSWLTLIMSYPCDPGRVFVSVLRVFVSVPIEGFDVGIFVSLLTEGFDVGIFVTLLTEGFGVGIFVSLLTEGFGVGMFVTLLTEGFDVGIFVTLLTEGFGVGIFVSLLTEGFTRCTETRPQRPDFPQTDESIVSSILFIF